MSFSSGLPDPRWTRPSLSQKCRRRPEIPHSRHPINIAGFDGMCSYELKAINLYVFIDIMIITSPYVVNLFAARRYLYDSNAAVKRG